MSGRPPPTIPQVLSQHAEEAAFIWVLRDAAVHAPHYSLQDLAELDTRLDAHLDGLRIAADPGWEICQEELAWEEPGEVFAAAVLAFESGDAERIEQVLEAGSQSVELSRGAISALGWLIWEQAQPHIRALLASEEPMRRRIGIGAAAVHRQEPGGALEDALASDQPELQARALRAVGELGRVPLLEHSRKFLASEDTECRFSAAWSAALVNEAGSIPVLREIAESGHGRAERACDLAVRRMDPSDAMAWQRDLASREEHGRLACIAARALGDPALVPWLLEMMRVDELARPAGEAFSFITGLDLAYEDLEGEWPEGFEAGPTENPEDEGVSMDADEDLPWPDPELITKWWEKNRSRFSPGTRYLLGKPTRAECLEDVLRTGRQRQRAAAALELALLEPTAPLFEVRARGDRQMQVLGIR